jgi:hypothetical protein
MSRLAIVFGRGRIFSSKPVCRSGRAGMEQMRFTCSGKIEMPKAAASIVLDNCRLDLQAKGTPISSAGSPLASKGTGEGEGCGRDLLRQTTPVALKPLTLVLSPFRRGEAREHAI